MILSTTENDLKFLKPKPPSPSLSLPAMATVLLHLLVSSLWLFSATSSTPLPRRPSPPPASSPTNCSDELVAFSVCLPFISSHPNNQTHSPSNQCCQAITSSVTSQTTICLCYLVQQPLILGFPLNSSRLMSLTSLCLRPIEYRISSKFSLKSLCDGLPTLPPLRSIKGPDGQPIQWTPGGDDLVGSPEYKSGPGHLSPPSTHKRANNNTKPAAPPVHASVPAPAPAGANTTEKPGPGPAPAGANTTTKPGPVPTSASSNTTKVPGPVPIPGDDYSDYEHGNSTSDANNGRHPGSLSSAFTRCSSISKWRYLLPQIIILVSLLSSSSY